MSKSVLYIFQYMFEFPVHVSYPCNRTQNDTCEKGELHLWSNREQNKHNYFWQKYLVWCIMFGESNFLSICTTYSKKFAKILRRRALCQHKIKIPFQHWCKNSIFHFIERANRNLGMTLVIYRILMVWMILKIGWNGFNAICRNQTHWIPIDGRLIDTYAFRQRISTFIFLTSFKVGNASLWFLIFRNPFVLLIPFNTRSKSLKLF